MYKEYHAANNEGMDSYREAIDHMEISLTDKMQFLPGSGRNGTAVWMHHLEAN